MKRYIWTPQVAADNLKRIGRDVLVIVVILALGVCPVGWA
jgi:hypothetical protein